MAIVLAMGCGRDSGLIQIPQDSREVIEEIEAWQGLWEVKDGGGTDGSRIPDDGRGVMIFNGPFVREVNWIVDRKSTVRLDPSCSAVDFVGRRLAKGLYRREGNRLLMLLGKRRPPREMLDDGTLESLLNPIPCVWDAESVSDDTVYLKVLERPTEERAARLQEILPITGPEEVTGRGREDKSN